jgi:hypothetical protein
LTQSIGATGVATRSTDSPRCEPRPLVAVGIGPS